MMVFVAALFCAISFLQNLSKPGKNKFDFHMSHSLLNTNVFNSSNEIKKINNRILIISINNIIFLQQA